MCHKHHVPLAGFCLSLHDLHVLNRDVNMIQIIKQTKEQTITLSNPVGAPLFCDILDINLSRCLGLLLQQVVKINKIVYST